MQGSPTQGRALVICVCSPQQQLQRAQELADVSTHFISCACDAYSHITMSRVSVPSSFAAEPFCTVGHKSDICVLSQQSKAANNAEKYCKSLGLCNEGLQLDFEDDEIKSQLYSNRGHANVYLGQYIAALSETYMAIELSPLQWEAFHARSLAYQLIGDYTLAAQVGKYWC